MTKVFNYHKFYLALNLARKMRRNIAWNKVATRVGMSPSSIHAFVRQFEDPTRPEPKSLSLENVVKLLGWLNVTDLEPYIVEEDDPDVST